MAATGVVESADGDDWRYVATLEDVAIEKGEPYTVIAVSGDFSTPLMADQIIYLDQKNASQDGKVVFDGFGNGFIPKNYGGGKVYVSGKGLANPRYIGDIPAHGFGYSGTISSYSGIADLPVVTLTAAGQAPITATVTGSAGSFNFSFSAIPVGQYTLQISQNQHGTWTEQVNITTNSTNISKVLRRLGDLNGDNYVNIADLVRVNNYILGKATLDDYQKICGDVNSDNLINIGDVVLINRFILGKITAFN